MAVVLKKRRTAMYRGLAPPRHTVDASYACRSVFCHWQRTCWQLQPNGELRPRGQRGREPWQPVQLLRPDAVSVADFNLENLSLCPV